MKIEFDNSTIEFNVQYSKRKKIYIDMDAGGFITVKVPNDTNEETIINVVMQHGKKIIEHQQNIAKAKDTTGVKEYHEEGKFLHLGKLCFLHELIEIGELKEEELQLKLKKFYFTSCKKTIEDRIKKYQTELRVKPKSIEIVESRTKWGSCSSDKKLTFNYRLAMAPVEVIDYVIVHELCHLLHMNHDRSFWRKVGSIMPSYKEKEDFLDRFGQAMTL